MAGYVPDWVHWIMRQISDTAVENGSSIEDQRSRPHGEYPYQRPPVLDVIVQRSCQRICPRLNVA
jgi:hypothetical protein